MHKDAEQGSGAYASMQCPRCGTAFLVNPAQAEGLCFNCGTRLDLVTIRRDVRAKSLGFAAYSDLLGQADHALASTDFSGAAALFRKAAAAAPEDYHARYGILMAATNNLCAFPDSLPDGEYQDAIQCATATERAQLEQTWNGYVSRYNAHQRKKLEAERQRREKQRAREALAREQARKERERKERERQRQAAPAADASADGQKKRRRLHPVVRYLLIGAGAALAVLGLAACSAMGSGGMIFLLVGMGMLGGGGDRRRRR